MWPKNEDGSLDGTVQLSPMNTRDVIGALLSLWQGTGYLTLEAGTRH